MSDLRVQAGLQKGCLKIETVMLAGEKATEASTNLPPRSVYHQLLRSVAALPEAPIPGSFVNLSSCSAKGVLVLKVKCQSFGNLYHGRCLQDHFHCTG